MTRFAASTLGFAALAVLLAACEGEPLKPTAPATIPPVTGPDFPPLRLMPPLLDVLFVLDNSYGTEPLQMQLAAHAASFVDALKALPKGSARILRCA